MELGSSRRFCECRSWFSYSTLHISTLLCLRRPRFLSKPTAIKRKNSHLKSCCNRIYTHPFVFRKIWKPRSCREVKGSYRLWIIHFLQCPSNSGQKRIKWVPHFLYYKCLLLEDDCVFVWPKQPNFQCPRRIVAKMGYCLLRNSQVR